MPFEDFENVYSYLLDVRDRRGTGFMMLLDPDRAGVSRGMDAVRNAERAGVDAILVGASLMMGDGFSRYVDAVREAVSIPVIVFPGEKGQVTGAADAILFLSLLSGRNPEYLICQQVKSAPVIRSLGVEPVSTAYLLIESGRMTSVEFMSNTKPIPADKPEIAVAHAMAAEMFGMKMIYLEAGSGAERPVPSRMISAVTTAVDIPVIVGGGLRTPGDVAAKAEAGASFVVIGNHLEDPGNDAGLAALVRAAHYR